MRAVWFVFLGSALCFSSPAGGQEPAPGPNLLQNPGFEAGGTTPAGWTTFSPSPHGITYAVDVTQGISPRSRCCLQLVFRDASNRILQFVYLPGHTGTREFALDFPPKLKVRAPAGAARAEVNLFLSGTGSQARKPRHEQRRRRYCCGFLRRDQTTATILAMPAWGKRLPVCATS